MAIGAFVPLLLFVVILCSVGVRLMLLWRRTRQVPELTLGLGLVLVGLSIPLSGFGRAPATALEPIGRLAFCLGLSGAVTGIALIVFFTYWVFRRGSGWAMTFFAFICAVLALSVAYMSAMNFTGPDVAAIKQAMRPGTVAMMSATAICFGWGGIEALRYHAASRRQLALGLSDPVIVNRFLLWGIAGIASSFQIAVIMACVLANMTILLEPLPLAVMASTGILSSATWYLTFFAPPRYQRFLRERASQRA